MLKLVQWNINGPGTKHGPWERRRALIAGVLQRAAPEVVVLQAVHRPSAGRDQAAQLAADAGFRHVHFAPATENDDGSADGLAVLSRLPLAATRRVALTRREDVEDPFDRIALIARFDLSSGPLHVADCHFSWVEAQACDNVAETLPHLDALKGPAVVLGDMNRPADAESMRQFARRGWGDAWAALQSGAPGFTFESHAPSLRIDYAWLNEAARPALKAIEIVGAAAERDVRPSDHFGLLLTLDLDR